MGLSIESSETKKWTRWKKRMSGKPNKDQIKSNFYLADIQLIPVLFDIYTQTENNCTYVKDLNRKPINPNKRSFMH